MNVTRQHPHIQQELCQSPHMKSPIAKSSWYLYTNCGELIYAYLHIKQELSYLARLHAAQSTEWLIPAAQQQAPAVCICGGMSHQDQPTAGRTTSSISSIRTARTLWVQVNTAISRARYDLASLSDAATH